MSDDTILPFGFPAIDRKKLIAAFGGRITTDGGVLLLGAVERRLGIAAMLARLIADPRNPVFVTHSVDDILRARILAIASATKTPTISTICVPILPSSWPATAGRTAAAICARSRRCRVGRTRRACARWCA
jgi:hypothetical protein